MTKTERILKWFKEHKMFSYNAMCNEIGIDSGNFCRDMKAGRIPKKHILAIENVIKEYGYKEK